MEFVSAQSQQTIEMEKPFLDVAQFFLDEDDTDRGVGEVEEEEEEQGLNQTTETSQPYKTFTAAQLQEALLGDSNKTFIPIGQELDESFPPVGLPALGANPLLFLNEEEELYPCVGRDFLSSFPDGLPGDDLLLTDEGDLFIEEASFFNFSPTRELEERDRTPSPANVDTEKEDEGEGEEQIKMEDRAARITISPHQLHSPSAFVPVTLAPKIEPPKDVRVPLLLPTLSKPDEAKGLLGIKEPASPTKSRKRSIGCISGSKVDQKRTKRKRKTPEQLAVLEREFDANPMPNKEVRDQLSSRLGLTSRQVQIWFQNKRAKVKNSNASASPTQSPTPSRASSPLPMLAGQQPQQQQGQQQPQLQKGQQQPRLIPANFSPESLAAMTAVATHPIPLAPHTFFDILSGRGVGVNQFLASLATLTPHQQQAIADLPAIFAHNGAHMMPTPIAPAPAPTMLTPIAPAPATTPIPILPASPVTSTATTSPTTPDIQKAAVNTPVATAV